MDRKTSTKLDQRFVILHCLWIGCSNTTTYRIKLEQSVTMSFNIQKVMCKLFILDTQCSDTFYTLTDKEINVLKKYSRSSEKPQTEAQ